MSQMALNHSQMQNDYSKRLEQSLIQMNKPVEPIIRPPVTQNQPFNLGEVKIQPQLPTLHQTKPFSFTSEYRMAPVK